jgi:hypothetical protein
MAASSIQLYMDRVNSTLGTGSLLKTSSAGLTNATVALTAPASAQVQYSTPLPTRGGAPTLTGSTTRPNPDGTGWFLEDSTTMTGKRIYFDVATTARIAFETWSGAADVWVTMRFWKYNTLDGSYTFCGSLTDSAIDARQNNDANFSGTMGTSQNFASTDRLYVDFHWYYFDAASTARTVNMRTGDTLSNINLRVIPSSDLAPVNDAFAGAVALNQSTSDARVASNIYSSYEDGEPLWAQYSGGGGFTNPNIDGPGSLWWKWTCPTGVGIAAINFNTVGSFSHVFNNLRLNTRMRIWTAETPTPTFAQLTLVAENDNQGSYSDNGAFEDNPPMSPDKYSNVLIMNPEEGRTYWVQVMTCSFNGDVDPPSSTGNVHCRSVPSYRGEWIFRDNVVLTNADETTLNQTGYTNDGYTNNAGVNFTSSHQFHGFWAIWQFAPYPNPAPDPRAYEVASKITYCGDQSRDENGNNRDMTWDPDDQDGDGGPTILPGPYRCCGRIGPIFDMGSQSQATDGSLPSGAGSNGAATASGGYASISPSFPGLCNWSSYWGFRTFNPRHPAHVPAIWTYLGKLPGSSDTSGLPAGVQGVVYSKHCAEVVRFRVRPGSAGASAHPSNGLFGQTITGEWWEIPNSYPTAPTWGLWRNGSGQWVCRTNTTPGNYPTALPGDMRTMGGRHIGNATFAGGVQTSRGTTWTTLLEYDVQEPNDVLTTSDVHIFGFGADFVMNDEDMGNQVATAQAGSSSWSFTRHISGTNLEYEIELKLPCYAFLYPEPQYPTAECPGMVIPPPPDNPQIDGGLVETREHFWRGRNSDG